MPESQHLPARSPQDHPPSPPPAPARRQGEFILSGSLTPPVLPGPGADRSHDLGGVPAVPMPGFHLRTHVQVLLRRWRNGLSLCGQIRGSSAPGARENAERFILPQHTTYIR
ncbi:hypothetical protein AC792_06365 [Arthrobacter sp. RIT-PI-e]|uniref:hypothetical protein n=1 Tax=Arthrobacter sp. RIT-PI-e TaxID=1681197 RepID=UPI0006A0968F|nr:hypothetical protein [Arthrobacter sp. RIT-PI-e]KNC19463.1 hypothetical protein AC792_06365 [Arthrobacter sp. RIT-PI-e]